MNNIIEGGYLRDILDQPKALRLTVDGLREDPGLLDVGKRMRQVCSSGSREFSARAARLSCSPHPERVRAEAALVNTLLPGDRILIVETG
jgi:hypothetical protein